MSLEAGWAIIPPCELEQTHPCEQQGWVQVVGGKALGRRA